MASEWPIVRLGDYCRKIGSGATPRGGKSTYLERGEFALIRSQNVYNDGFRPDGLAFISPGQAAALNGVSVEAGDVLVNITGDSVARVCQAPSSVIPARVNQHVAIVRPDSDEFDPRFIRYFLTAPEQQERLLSLASVGATRPALTKGMLEQLKIPKLPMRVQRDVVEPLWTIDQRIGALRQSNATLEAITQALFKSWFVNFDPVCAKSEGREPEGVDPAVAAIFPAEFEDSALGPIPKGWQAVPFGSLLRTSIGGDWGGEELDQENSERIAIIRGTDIPDLRSQGESRIPVRYSTPKKISARRLEVGDLVVEVSGGSKNQPTGRSVRITDAVLERFDCAVVPASFCRKFSPVSTNIGLLLAQHMDFIYASGRTWEYQNQSTGIANFQTRRFLEVEHVIVPTGRVLMAFCDVVAPIMERCQSSSIGSLMAIRDTLLPRLMSGKLRLPEAEREIEAATA